MLIASHTYKIWQILILNDEIQMRMRNGKFNFEDPIIFLSFSAYLGLGLGLIWKMIISINNEHPKSLLLFSKRDKEQNKNAMQCKNLGIKRNLYEKVTNKQLEYILRNRRHRPSAIELVLHMHCTQTQEETKILRFYCLSHPDQYKRHTCLLFLFFYCLFQQHQLA